MRRYSIPAEALPTLIQSAAARVRAGEISRMDQLVDIFNAKEWEHITGIYIRRMHELRADWSKIKAWELTQLQVAFDLSEEEVNTLIINSRKNS